MFVHVLGGGTVCKSRGPKNFETSYNGGGVRVGWGQSWVGSTCFVEEINKT